MPNLNNIFLKYDTAISLTPAKRIRLRSSKQAIERAITTYFRNDRRMSVPSFFIQGSYKMKTMIVKKNNTYDVDLGVYFYTYPNIEPRSLQQNVVRAIQFQTAAGATHKEKCVRVNYQGEFNIDLPVYYYDKGRDISFLATKSGWEESDPKILVDWYFSNDGESEQLQRIIKYLKAWSDNHRYKMPSGIALTVWATQKYSPNRRDDIALYNTVLGIKRSLFWNGVICTNPAPPEDDLVSKLTRDQKARFKSELTNLLEDLDDAIESDNLLIAMHNLRSHFGQRFKL